MADDQPDQRWVWGITRPFLRTNLQIQRCIVAVVHDGTATSSHSSYYTKQRSEYSDQYPHPTANATKTVAAATTAYCWATCAGTY